MFNPFAILWRVFRVGLFSPRSIMPIYVRSKPHLNANASWERLFAVLKSANLFPKAMFIGVLFMLQNYLNTD